MYIILQYIPTIVLLKEVEPCESYFSYKKLLSGSVKFIRCDFVHLLLLIAVFDFCDFRIFLFHKGFISRV